MMSDRAVLIIEDLERLLQEFIRKHRISHDEYRLATELIIASVQAGEESLLFDVFLEAEATDVGNAARQGSSVAAIEGPFYVPGAPQLPGPPYTMPHSPDQDGVPLTFRGTVSDVEGNPLAGAELDLWHADADGLYSNIHPGIPDWNLRGRFQSAPDGSFEVATLLPPPYEIPKNGPTGTVLNALGRHFFRPAHLHLKLRHPGCQELTSQLYFEGGDYLDSDVANAVRDGLVLEPVKTDTGVEARYDFVLQPRSGQAGS